VIAVQMRDDHGVEVAHNLIGWERKGDERARRGFGVFSTGGRAPTSSSIGSTRTRLPPISSRSVAFRMRVTCTVRLTPLPKPAGRAVRGSSR
jgi:hypothetical protein